MKKRPVLLSPPLVALMIYLTALFLLIFCLKNITLLAAPVFFALVIAYLFNPLANLLERKTPLSRSVISALIIIFLVFSFILGTIILLPGFIERIKRAAVGLPVLLQSFSEKLEVVSVYLTKNFSQYIGNVDIMSSIEESVSSLLNNLSNLLITGFSSLYGVVVTLLFLILVPLFAYHFLKDYYRIKKALFALIPRWAYPSISAKIQQMDDILSSFIRGQAIVVVILAILYSIGLSLIGLPFPVLVGVFSGLGDIIPYLGTITGLIISLIIGIATFPSLQNLLLILLVFGLVKGSEHWYFYPRIVGREVGLHFVWVLISIIIFGQLFGFWGLLLAIPASAGFKVFLSDLLTHYKQSGFFTKR